MDEAKRCEIERLAADSYDKRMRYRSIGMMNAPTSYDEQKALAIEVAIARREMIEADRLLEDALNA